MAYKLQIFCLMILIYIVVSFCWNNYKKTKSRHTIIFQWMLITGIVYLFLDMITVYTVNHLTTVNPILNRFLHWLFLLSIFTFLFLVFVYLCALCELDFSSKRMKACIFMPFFLSVIIATISIGSLEYIIGKSTNYSMGVSAYVCYAIGFAYMLLGMGIFYKRRNYIASNKVRLLLLAFIVVIGTIVVQMIFPETLISSIAATAMLLVIFMNVENSVVAELDNIHEEMIYSFADIVESRDGSAGEHIKRTTVYVRLIAEQLRKKDRYANILTKDYIDCLTVSASMHDIGKIAIPDAILQKPGRLTDEEFDVMKQHTVKGAELIQNAFYSSNQMYCKMLYDIAMFHHEKWSGKGYPQGLQKNEIPLCARIMSVADVFDAVSQDRCYRKAMSLDEAFGIIEKGIGTDFDPEIAEAFISVRKQVETEYQKFVTREMKAESSPMTL